jgi:hypothetical protein
MAQLRKSLVMWPPIQSIITVRSKKKSVIIQCKFSIDSNIIAYIPSRKIQKLIQKKETDLATTSIQTKHHRSGVQGELQNLDLKLTQSNSRLPAGEEHAEAEAPGAEQQHPPPGDAGVRTSDSPLRTHGCRTTPSSSSSSQLPQAAASHE